MEREPLGLGLDPLCNQRRTERVMLRYSMEKLDRAVADRYRALKSRDGA